MGKMGQKIWNSLRRKHPRKFMEITQFSTINMWVIQLYNIISIISDPLQHIFNLVKSTVNLIGVNPTPCVRSEIMLRQPTLGGSADVVNGAWEKYGINSSLNHPVSGQFKKDHELQLLQRLKTTRMRCPKLGTQTLKLSQHLAVCFREQMHVWPQIWAWLPAKSVNPLQSRPKAWVSGAKRSNMELQSGALVLYTYQMIPGGVKEHQSGLRPAG